MALGREVFGSTRNYLNYLAPQVSINAMSDNSIERSTPVQVVADDREAPSGVVEALSQIAGVQVTLQRLGLGDYWVDGQCVFERKTLPDFVASIKEGRLFVQAQRLAEAPGRVAIILEGRTRDLADSLMRREAIQGALISLSLVFNLPVLRSLDPGETARLMVYAAHQLRRTAKDAVGLKGKRPRRKRRIQLRILQGLPGIGPVRAEELLDTLGSVEAVVTAQSAVLEKIKGIGEKTAATIRWAVHDPPAPNRMFGEDYAI